MTTERLRKIAAEISQWEGLELNPPFNEWSDALDEAADEIERLENRLEQAQDDVRHWENRWYEERGRA